MHYCFRPLQLGCLLFLAGCQPLVAPRMGQPNPTEDYIHTPSDFRFPPTVAGFARETVKQYDREGRDVSVGYNQGQSIAMTVYVYPIPAEGPDSSLESHFQKCKSEVVSRHQGVELLSDGPVTASPGGQQRSGRHAAFKYNERFAQRQQDVHSELYVFVNGSWFIKYRVTCPAGQKGTVEPAIKAFIEALNWPIGNQG